MEGDGEIALHPKAAGLRVEGRALNIRERHSSNMLLRVICVEEEDNAVEDGHA